MSAYQCIGRAFTNTNRHTIQVGRLHEVGETAGSLMKQGTK